MGLEDPRQATAGYLPILAPIYCTAGIIGSVRSAIHRVPYPNEAPAMA